jgi:hypothetical protein
MHKALTMGTPLEKRELLKAYIKRLSEYQYLIQHPAFKHFIEKKMDIKKHITDAYSQSSAASSATPQPGETNPFEIADRYREIFGYLMEVPIEESEYKVIREFYQFLK